MSARILKMSGVSPGWREGGRWAGQQIRINVIVGVDSDQTVRLSTNDLIVSPFKAAAVSLSAGSEGIYLISPDRRILATATARLCKIFMKSLTQVSSFCSLLKLPSQIWSYTDLLKNRFFHLPRAVCETL